MVFLSINEPLEDFLKRDKETRLNEMNWFLFDYYIKNKNINYNDFFKGNGFLAAYMDRIFVYPIYYNEPLYCYLFSVNEFRKLDFFPEQYKNISCIWNMAKVPDIESDEEKYPRIPAINRIFGKGEYKSTKEYIRTKFEELIGIDLTNNQYACVVLDGK